MLANTPDRAEPIVVPDAGPPRPGSWADRLRRDRWIWLAALLAASLLGGIAGRSVGPRAKRPPVPLDPGPTVGREVPRGVVAVPDLLVARQTHPTRPASPAATIRTLAPPPVVPALDPPVAQPPVESTPVVVRSAPVSVGFVPPSVGTPPAATRPNIILIHTDSAADEPGEDPAGCPTPTLDGLASSGLRFGRCLNGRSGGAAGRYQVLTGRYASRSETLLAVYPRGGAADVADEWVAVGENEPTLASILRQHGYATGFVGEWNFANQIPPEVRAKLVASRNASPFEASRYLQEAQESQRRLIRRRGFDDVARVCSDEAQSLLRGTPYGVANPEWLAAGALDFIERHEQEPFLLCLFAPAIVDPPGDLVLANPLCTAGGLIEPGPALLPSRATLVERAHGRARWLGRIYRDEVVALVLRALDERHLTANTLVIVTGAEAAGAMPTPGPMTRPGLLLMQWGDRIRSGTVRDELTTGRDVAPTILDACGVDPIAALPTDGRSLLPLLAAAPPADWRRSILMEQRMSRSIVTSDGWEYDARRWFVDPRRADPNNPSAVIVGNGRLKYAGVEAEPDLDAIFLLSLPPDQRWMRPGHPGYLAELNRLRDELQHLSQGMPHPFAEFGNHRPPRHVTSTPSSVESFDRLYHELGLGHLIPRHRPSQPIR